MLERAEAIQIYLRDLAWERSVSLGAIYRCRRCQAQWFLDMDQFMLFVDLEILQKWEHGELTPKNKILPVLEKIGGTPLPARYYRTGDIQFPCTVELLSGHVIEKAILRYCRTPPIDVERIRWVDEVESVLESPYAVSRAVRLQYIQIEEVSMGFEPVRAKVATGTDFVFNGIVNIFDQKPYRGADLIPTDSGRSTAELELVYEDPESLTFFGRWTEDLENLRLGGSSEQSYLSLRL